MLLLVTPVIGCNSPNLSDFQPKSGTEPVNTVSGTTKSGATVDVQVYESTISVKKSDTFTPVISFESKTNLQDSDTARAIIAENAFSDTKVIDGKTYDLVAMDGSRCAYYLPSSGKRSMRAMEMGRAANEFLDAKTSASEKYAEIDPNQIFMDKLAVRLEERAKQLGCDFKDLTEEDILACSEEVKNEIANAILQKAIEVTEENDAEAMQYQADLQQKIDTYDYSPEMAQRLANASVIDEKIQAENTGNARVLGGSGFEKDFGNDLDGLMAQYPHTGRSGDIGAYCTYIGGQSWLFVYHSFIYNRYQDLMLTSGSSRNGLSASSASSSSSNSDINGCDYRTRGIILSWLNADDIHQFHSMRVAKQLIGTVISGILRFFVEIQLFPRTTTFSSPNN